MEKTREGTLVILACCGVFDTAHDCFYGEHPEDRPVYDSQLVYAFNHLEWRKSVNPLLVISGAPTKYQLKRSESRSHLDRATEIGLDVPAEVELEEYALTSPENVLLSIYAFHRRRGIYPKSIEAISWEFKRRRFEKTLEAINLWAQLGGPWPALNYFPVGDLWGKPKNDALDSEEEDCRALECGIEAYYKSSRVQHLVRKRDVFNTRQKIREAYPGFPLPFEQPK